MWFLCKFNNILCHILQIPATNSSGVIFTYNVTSLRKDPSYITIYVNWFLLFVTGIIPMGSLMYFNSRIYAKILETRRLRERCKIRSSTTLALQEIKSDNNSTPNPAVPVAPNVAQEKRHSDQITHQCDQNGRLLYVEVRTPLTP